MIQPFSDISTPFIAAEGYGWYVVFKPSGMDSVPINSNSDTTLVDWIRSRISSEREIFDSENSRMEKEMGMVSRLDRETSGLILCARNPTSLNAFLHYQSQGLLAKRYRIRCTKSEQGLEGSRPIRIGAEENGNPLRAGRIIESYFRSYGEKARKVACILPEFTSGFRGKLSSGTYATELLASTRVLAENVDIGTLELEARIVKGFRHQIRAHLAWIGWPIDGDSLYGGKPSARLCLEACGVCFPDVDGKLNDIELYEKMV